MDYNFTYNNNTWTWIDLIFFTTREFFRCIEEIEGFPTCCYIMLYNAVLRRWVRRLSGKHWLGNPEVPHFIQASFYILPMGFLAICDELVGGFKHFFIFHNIWDVILPIDSYSSRWLKPPTPNLCKSETKSQSPTITTYHNYGAMIMEGDPSLSLSASGSWHDCRHGDKNSRARNWSHLEKTSRV